MASGRLSSLAFSYLSDLNLFGSVFRSYSFLKGLDHVSRVLLVEDSRAEVVADLVGDSGVVSAIFLLALSLTFSTSVLSTYSHSSLLYLLCGIQLRHRDS